MKEAGREELGKNKTQLPALLVEIIAISTSSSVEDFASEVESLSRVCPSLGWLQAARKRLP